MARRGAPRHLDELGLVTSYWHPMLKLHIPSPALMHRLGQAIAAASSEGTTVALSGDLGAGKTCLAQGVGAGLGVKGPVTSPTFQILAIYPGPGPSLLHADLYRLGDPSELTELGLDELLGQVGVAVVEWAERFPEVLPADHLDIRIDFAGTDARRVTVRATGPRSGVMEQSLGKFQNELL